MESNPPVVTVRFNKFLPYWAVFQTDLRQTARSWVYRLWVLMTVLAAAGLLLYRVGLHKEAGLFQSAAAQSSVVQSRYTEVRPRSTRKTPCTPWRARASTTASRALTSTSASTTRAPQKSGR